MMLDNAKQVLIEEKSRLRGLGVGRAGIFGSVARGEENPESDVDILLELQPGHHLTLLSLVELEDYLSDRLSRKVDIVIGPNIKPFIKERVYQEVQYVYP